MLILWPSDQHAGNEGVSIGVFFRAMWVPKPDIQNMDHDEWSRLAKKYADAFSVAYERRHSIEIELEKVILNRKDILWNLVYYKSAKAFRHNWFSSSNSPIIFSLLGFPFLFIILFVPIIYFTQEVRLSLFVSLALAVPWLVVTIPLATVPSTETLDLVLSEMIQALDKLDSEIDELKRQRFDELTREEDAKRQLDVLENMFIAKASRLLNRNWRELRGVPWEHFLAEVFRLHGAKVQVTKGSGDHGVDLVVEKGAIVLAVQAKGYSGAVNNKAVQEAVAGMAIYGCNRCAVITNSWFTRSAISLAEANGCILIDQSSFEGLVMRHFDIFL